MKDIAPHPRWKPLVEGADMPAKQDERDKPLEFDVNPAMAAHVRQQIEKHLIERNREDDARALGVALEDLA